MPILKINFCDNYCFQQDNTTVLTTKIVKIFLAGNEIKTLKWPVRSPYINITKDVWRMISYLICGGPQYQDIKFLEKLIIINYLKEKFPRVSNTKNYGRSLRRPSNKSFD